MIILIIIFAIIGMASVGAAVFVTIAMIWHGWRERREKREHKYFRV